MAERRADLHIHTYYSDGTMSPREVVLAAKRAGVSWISITDHDTVDALPEACVAGKAAAVCVITGAELSSEQARKDIHILGYGFRLDGSPLVFKLKEMQDARMERMRKMLDKLSRRGIKDISIEDVRAQTRSNAVGRLHLANLLLARGHVRSKDAAFERFLGEGCEAYFPKFNQTPREAIALIRDSGGVAVMAHPMLTNRDEVIPELVRAGLDGLEAFYPNCSMAIAEHYIGLADKHGLLVTGGSDAHGEGKKTTHIGKAWVFEDRVEILKKKVEERGGVWGADEPKR